MTKVMITETKAMITMMRVVIVIIVMKVTQLTRIMMKAQMIVILVGRRMMRIVRLTSCTGTTRF